MAICLQVLARFVWNIEGVYEVFIVLPILPLGRITRLIHQLFPIAFPAVIQYFRFHFVRENIFSICDDIMLYATAVIQSFTKHSRNAFKLTLRNTA